MENAMQLIVHHDVDTRRAKMCSRALDACLRRATDASELDCPALASEASHVIEECHSYIPHLIKRLQTPRGSAAVAIHGALDDGEVDPRRFRLQNLGLASLCGEPFGFIEGHWSALVRELRPELRFEHTQTELSRFRLNWRNEDALLQREHRSELIIDLGVLNPSRAATGLASIEKILPSLNPRSLEILTHERFVYRASWNDQCPHFVVSRPRPVLSQDPLSGEWLVSYDPLTQPANPYDLEAQEALCDLQAAADAARELVVVERGTWLILRNERLLYNRARILGDRLVLRTNARRDLRALQQATGSKGPLFDIRPLLMS